MTVARLICTRSLQAAFVAVFVLVLFYAEVPWAGLLLP